MDPEISYDRSLVEELFPPIYRMKPSADPRLGSPIWDADGVYYRIFRKGNRYAILLVFHFLHQDFPPHKWDYEPVIIFLRKEPNGWRVQKVVFDEIHYKAGVAYEDPSLVMVGPWRSFNRLKPKVRKVLEEARRLFGVRISWKDLSAEQREAYVSLWRRAAVTERGLLNIWEALEARRRGEITPEELVKIASSSIMVVPHARSTAIPWTGRRMVLLSTGEEAVVEDATPLSSSPEASRLGGEGLRYLVMNLLSPYDELFPEILGGLRPLTDDVVREWRSREENPLSLIQGWLEDPWEQDGKEDTLNGDPLAKVIAGIWRMVNLWDLARESREQPVSATVLVE